MKKLNATNAIVILSLGLTLSVVVAGCGGNDTSESAVTKNAKVGSSDGGAGGDSTKSATSNTAKAGSSDGGAGGGSTTVAASAPGSSDGGAGGGSTTVAASAPGSSDGGAGGGSTTIAASAAGSADGGTGESVTVSDSELLTYGSTCKAINGSYYYCTTLTKVQMNALTSAQWEKVDGYLSASQVASIPTKTIQSLTTAALEGLSAAGTQALTTEQLKVMSKDQLNALFSSGELTETQLETVNKKLKQLG